MSSISSGLFNAQTATISSNTGAITSTNTNINTGTTGTITSTTTNVYDSSGTLAAINSALTNLQASVLPIYLPYYVPGVSVASGQREAAKLVTQMGLPLMLTTTPYTNYIRGLIPSGGVANFNQWLPFFPPITSFTTINANRTQTVTTSNVDTVYNAAVIDLTQGPIIINVPDTSAINYFSIVFSDNRSDYTISINQRACGTGSRRYRIVGPNQLGSGPDTIRLLTNTGFILARVSIEGDDVALTRTNTFLTALTAGTVFPPKILANTRMIYPTSSTSAGVVNSKVLASLGAVQNFTKPASWEASFSALQDLMTRSYYSPYFNDTNALNKMALLKIGTTFDSSWNYNAIAGFDSSAVKLGIQDAVDAYLALDSGNRTTTSWSVSGSFAYLTYITQDYANMDNNDITGLLGNPLTETRYYVLYSNNTSGNYSTLNSALFNFNVPSDFVGTVRSLWSITGYQYNDASSGYTGLASLLTANAFYDANNSPYNVYDTSTNITNGRYSISNWGDASGTSRGNYHYIADNSGNVPIYLSQYPPLDLSGNSLLNNWLPIPSQTFIDASYNYVPQPPKSTKWALVIRFYNPPKSVKNNTWLPNAVQDNSGNSLFQVSARVY